MLLIPKFPFAWSIADGIARAAKEGGSYSVRTQDDKDNLIAAYEALLDEMEGRLDAAFDIRPHTEVAIVGGPWGGCRSTPLPGAARLGIAPASSATRAMQIVSMIKPSNAIHLSTGRIEAPQLLQGACRLAANNQSLTNYT